VVYGLTKNLAAYNPLRIAFHVRGDQGVIARSRSIGGKTPAAMLPQTRPNPASAA
jgi:hypothetical protein